MKILLDSELYSCRCHRLVSKREIKLNNEYKQIGYLTQYTRALTLLNLLTAFDEICQIIYRHTTRWETIFGFEKQEIKTSERDRDKDHVMCEILCVKVKNIYTKPMKIDSNFYNICVNWNNLGRIDRFNAAFWSFFRYSKQNKQIYTINRKIGERLWKSTVNH